MTVHARDKCFLRGSEWSRQAISQAKFLLKPAKKKLRQKATAATQPAAVPTDLISVAVLQKAKKLVQELGGVKEAKQALAALSQLLD